MLTHKKQFIENLIEPAIKPLSNINPNLLTLIGSIPPLLFFVFIVNGNYIFALIAIFGSVIDLLDGMIARKYNKVTLFGGFLDSTIDRMGDFLIISAFAFGKIARWEIIAPLLFFSFIISYIRSRAGLAAKSHTAFAIGLIERPERFLLLISALIFYIIYPDVSLYNMNLAELILILLTALSIYTVYQRIYSAYKQL